MGALLPLLHNFRIFTNGIETCQAKFLLCNALYLNLIKSRQLVRIRCVENDSRDLWHATELTKRNEENGRLYNK